MTDSMSGSDRPDRTWSPLLVQVAVLTDRGQVRAINEDNALVEDPRSLAARARGTLCVVCDGLGGHAAGEVASEIAVKTIRGEYYTGPADDPREALRRAIEAANAAVRQQALSRSEQLDMGCTATAAVIYGEDLVIGQVGDSRAYLIHDNMIRQITRDHSAVAELVAAGALTPEQARNHPQRNLITRALGRTDTVEVDIFREQLQGGDHVVLCSDGLTAVVTDQEIGQYATRYAPAQAAQELINLANQRGAPDNVTVGIVRVVDSKAPTVMS